MSELENVKDDLRALEAKIDAWFHRHFGALAPDTEMHKAAAAAHDDLKTIVGIAPAPEPTPQEVPPAA